MTVGEFTYGHDKIKVWWPEMANIHIGKFCSIALDGVEIYLGGNHHTDWVTTYPFGHIHQNIFNTSDGSEHPTTKGDVIIGNDVWIGNHVKIFSGVTIGDGAVIGAYSVVTKDVPPYTIVAGNPAEAKRKRFSDEDIEYLLKLQWWNWPVEKINENVPLLCSANLAGLKEAHPIKRKAIVLSGDYRTFSLTKHNLKRFIDDNDLDVFCHLWSDDEDEIRDIKETLKPKEICVESHTNYSEMFSNTEKRIKEKNPKPENIDNIKKMCSMHYARYKAFMLSGGEYDCIVYSRYDVQIPLSFKFDNIVGILTPSQESWGMISDIFAIMPKEYAQDYFLFPVFENLLSSRFEDSFIEYLRTLYPEESIRIHNDERYCPHMLLLRNLFLNNVPFDKADLPVYLQR